MNAQTIISLVACALAHIYGQSTSVDIVFLIDGSGSLTTEDYVRQKNIVIDVINNLDIGLDQTNVGAIVYSSSMGEKLQLAPPKGKNLIATLIRSLGQLNGGSNTAIGIRNAHSMLINQGRKSAKKFMVVFTDGRSENPSMTINEAQLAKDDDIVIFVVATGKNQPAEFEQEVQGIASNQYQTLIRADDFLSLDAFVDYIVQIVNPALKERIACQGTDSYVLCPALRKIQIIYAIYGRTSSKVCPSPPWWPGADTENTSCLSKTSYQIIKEDCDSRVFCRLTATNEVFNNPCRYTYKYLHIRYRCVLDVARTKPISL